MKLGDSGPDVKELQDLLLSHGFNIKIDGQFGPATQKAVKEFQSREGLVSDGIVQELTLKRLEGPKNHKDNHPNDLREVDERTLKYLKTLDPKAQALFLPFILESKKIAAINGYELKAISGQRGEEEQNALYAQGRTKPGNIVTNAKFGYSNHNFSAALDFGIFKDNKF